MLFRATLTGSARDGVGMCKSMLIEPDEDTVHDIADARRFAEQAYAPIWLPGDVLVVEEV